MAKRIMNEVTCLAEDNNIEMYYQDTDSIHMPLATLDKLADLYKQEYNKTLTGKALGQFSDDFDLKDATNVRSTEFIGITRVYQQDLGRRLVLSLRDNIV